MDVRVPRYAPVLVLLLAIGVAACDNHPTQPTPATSVVSLSSTVTVEPAVLPPEFLHASSCAARDPFGLRLRIILSGADALTVRGIRFRLVDPFGTSALPEVIPVPSGQEASLIPSSSQSLPLPGASVLPASPIPIPGVSPLTNVQVTAGTPRPLPFFLRFGCGVVPEGTLFVMTDVVSHDGRKDTPQIRVRVGGR